VRISQLNTFQLVVVPLLAVLFVRSLISMGRGRHRRFSAVAALVWLGASITVLRPDVTAVVARAMGIGRGTDVVLYFFLIFFLAASLYFYNRVIQLDSAITKIVRQAALREAHPPAPQIPQEKNLASDQR
jgi:hypothetical protein